MPNDNKKHSIHTTKHIAEKLQSLIDKDNSLPRCNCASCGGIEVGSGIFTPHNQCQTIHIHNIKKRPKEEKYAHPMIPDIQARVIILIEQDDSLSPQEKQSLLDAANNPIDLDASWDETITIP